MALGAKGCVAVAQGAEALVGALKKRGTIMIKPSQPPLRAKGKQANRACGAWEKSNPLWYLQHHLSPSSRGHYGCSALRHMTLLENIERPILPPE